MHMLANKQKYEGHFLPCQMNALRASLCSHELYKQSRSKRIEDSKWQRSKTVQHLLCTASAMPEVLEQT